MSKNNPTYEELIADAAADLARKQFDQFRLKHENYFQWEGRKHPETGALLIQNNITLDRESTRLFLLNTTAQKHAAQVEYVNRNSDSVVVELGSDSQASSHSQASRSKG